MAEADRLLDEWEREHARQLICDQEDRIAELEALLREWRGAGSWLTSSPPAVDLLSLMHRTDAALGTDGPSSHE